MIKIIALGKIKEPYLMELIEDYKKRISKYHKIDIIELKDTNDLEEEAKSLLKNIDPKDYCIVCDIGGDSLSSEEFAKLLDSEFIHHGTIDIVIGSSEGLHSSVKARADKKISFSKLTMPHGLFRGVLLEQIYRAFKINNNETYHK